MAEVRQKKKVHGQALDTRKTKRLSAEQAFFSDFSAVRQDLFEHLKANNPGIDAKRLVEMAQKVLGRFVFMLLYQGIEGFLPHSALRNIYDDGIRPHGYGDQRVWRGFRNLCREIVEGMHGAPPPADPQGGGFFGTDEVLDTVVILDDIWEATEVGLRHRNGVWKSIFALADHDLLKAQDVNVLGRLFEQSISDMEQIQAQMDCADTGGSNSKRKKNGIFYTPEFITRYIVERTLGRYLDETPDKLDTIAVLDPACGAGVFLNQALDFLWQRRIGGAETDRVTSLKNLYGVDLNGESVEITKLALWLNTAKKHQKLESLDANVRRGDSLADDPTIAGTRAFAWENEFRGVMEGGGFDVVVGNPPYVNIDAFGHGSPMFGHLKDRYADVYMDKSDLLFYFIKKGIDLLRDGGMLGYIVSNAFLFSDKAKKLRNHILDTCSVLEVVNFEQHNVFRDAGITTCILVLQKKGGTRATKACVFKEKGYTEGEIVDALGDGSSFFDVVLSKDAPFALVDDAVAKLNEKIDRGLRRLGEMLHVGSGMETAANEVFSFDGNPERFPRGFVRRRLRGDMISRYHIGQGTEYLLYLEDAEIFEDLPESIRDHLEAHREALSSRADKKRRATSKWWNYTFPMHKDYYRFDKIWCSYRAKKNEFAYDDSNDFIGLTNTTVIFGDNDECDLKYVLALLNSRLLDFRYKSIGKQTGGGVFEYFSNGIEKLPIPAASAERQLSLAQKAQRMMELSAGLAERHSSAHALLMSKFGLKKFPPSLDALHLLDEAELLHGMERAKAKLSMKGQQELLDWFRTERAAMQAIGKEMDVTDRAIDTEVYALYGMTPEEIEAIEDA